MTDRRATERTAAPVLLGPLWAAGGLLAGGDGAGFPSGPALPAAATAVSSRHQPGIARRARRLFHLVTREAKPCPANS